jgi:hypothetical protein
MKPTPEQRKRYRAAVAREHRQDAAISAALSDFALTQGAEYLSDHDKEALAHLVVAARKIPPGPRCLMAHPRRRQIVCLKSPNHDGDHRNGSFAWNESTVPVTIHDLTMLTEALRAMKVLRSHVGEPGVDVPYVLRESFTGTGRDLDGWIARLGELAGERRKD